MGLSERVQPAPGAQPSHGAQVRSGSQEPDAALPSAVIGSRHRLPGAAIGGRYHVVDVLGRGGMGVVYRVEDRSTGAQLALKQLKVEAGGRAAEQATSLFEREYYTLAQLAHPRVIAVHDYGLDPVGPFYTMELLDGGDLKEIAPLAVTRACRLLLDVCSSLALLHSRRLVHRDISPRNIRWTHDGHAKLIDFGAMVPMGPCSHTVGTPAFTAPEVLHHSTLDARTDLFSLGASLYYTLTGRVPFTAQRFSDLRQAWAQEPPLPSSLVDGIPPALDALCVALLHIDPARRPASAFEVIQRLTAAAGIQSDESLEVSNAYLAAPVLIGRDLPVRRFRRATLQSLAGAGACLRFEGAAGIGRSRMLDACVLQAKTLGATVLRAAPSSAEARPFAVAEHLARQLLEAWPEEARAAAQRAQVAAQIFEQPNSEATNCEASGSEASNRDQLRRLADASPEQRADLQAALADWLVSAAGSRVIVLAIDDVESVDEASVALLAALALRAPAHRLLIVYARDTGAATGMMPSHGVLAGNSMAIELHALSAAQTGALLVSVFGEVPNIALLADRLYKLALGNARDTLDLAQHLVDNGVLRYDNGQWTLPSELSDAVLPADVAEVLDTRIAALPELARTLAETQALLGTGALRREDYRLLSPESSAAEIDGALARLLALQLIECDGEFHTLCHRSLGEALRNRLDGGQLRARHLALHAFHVARGQTHPYVLAPHLLDAGRERQALDALAAGWEIMSEEGGLEALLRMDRLRIVDTLERCLELCVHGAPAGVGQRPAREAHELRRKLVALSAVCDEPLHARYGPAWLAQLELDSGLSDYRALSAELEPAARLQQALGAAMQRYAQTPESERVYTLEEALKHLGTYVVLSIMVGARELDHALFTTLPPLLEPFAGLSPALHALWQNGLSQLDHYRFGRSVTASRRWQEVYDRLGEATGGAVTYAKPIRYALAVGLGMGDVERGGDAALRWAKVLDGDPLQRVQAMHVRRLWCLNRGDTEGAARYEREAEVRSLQGGTAELFNRLWTFELNILASARNLGGVKRALEAMEGLACKHAGWQPLRHFVDGHLQALRGDQSAAKLAFEQARALSGPEAGLRESSDVWAVASAGLVAALHALGEVEAAVRLGQAALKHCRQTGMQLVWHGLACQLALAEAKLGDLSTAVERVEEVIEEQNTFDLCGLARALSHEARARLAVWAGDGDAARHYAGLALRERGGRGAGAANAPFDALVEDARQAGIDMSFSPSEFEVSVLGTAVTQQADGSAVGSARVTGALSACDSAEARGLAALQLLCSITEAPGGQLYLVGPDRELALAASLQAQPPSADAIGFARGFFAQQLDDEEMTGAFTQATHMDALPGAASYADPSGKQHRLFILSCKREAEIVYVGLAVLIPGERPVEALEILVEGPALAAALLDAGDSPGKRPSEISY